MLLLIDKVLMLLLSMLLLRLRLFHGLVLHPDDGAVLRSHGGDGAARGVEGRHVGADVHGGLGGRGGEGRRARGRRGEGGGEAGPLLLHRGGRGRELENTGGALGVTLGVLLGEGGEGALDGGEVDGAKGHGLRGHLGREGREQEARVRRLDHLHGGRRGRGHRRGRG